jgi:branched-chain amino acid transport system substrate-binding protein
LLAGCSTQQPVLAPSSPGVVRIVSSLPSRGSSAQQTLAIEDAIRTALAERGGAAGTTRVVYDALNDSDEETGDWSRQSEVANVTTAANDPSVVAYIGPYNSGAAMLAIPVANRAGLLEISPSATWPGLTQQGWDPGEPDKYFPTGTRNFVRLMPPDSKQADAAAQWASQLRTSHVAILEDGSSYSSGLANEFEAAAAANGISVTGQTHITAEPGTNVLSQFGGAPAVFYAPSTAAQAANVARALQQDGVDVFATDTALDPQFIERAGDAARRWKIVSNSAPPDGNGHYASLTKQGRTFSSRFAANAYDATNLIMDGIASGTGTDRSALVKYVSDTTILRDGARVRLLDSLGDPTSWVVSGYVVTASGLKLDRTLEGTN